ncbi:MAG: universal stress protein [Myxococcota bacterium]|nr:universal stress protein [Myxococcota bacterium]
MSKPRKARRSTETTGAPFGRILVATDFSHGADLALRRALRLPLTNGARVHLLHVVPGALPARLRKDALALARQRLEEHAARARAEASARGLDLVVDGPRQGQPFVEFIRAARRRRAQLVVVGRHGERRVRDLFIGTTAQRVVRKGDVPVLVVARPVTDAYRKPLVAVDLEDGSPAVIDLALRAVGRDGPPLDVVHVYHVPFEGFVAPSMSERERAQWRESFQRTAQEGMERLLAPYRAAGVRCRPFLRRGDPRAVVLALAERLGTDLLVAGTHGRTGLAHVLVGSVACWLLDAARCDVLVARPLPFTFALP